MTWATPANLATGLKPKAAKKKDIRRGVASTIEITGCLERATLTLP
jgi:hypothetical protein